MAAKDETRASARRSAGPSPTRRVAAEGERDRGGGRGGVAGIQRARILVAMVEVAAERGAGQATVAHVVTRSGVSRRTFYELFEDREACFLAAFDEGVQRGAARVLPAFRVGASSWRGRVRAGLAALLEFLDDEPGLGALCIVDALGAGPPALERRAQVVRTLVDAVDEGRAQARGSLKPTRLTAEGVVGAVLGVLHGRLVDGRLASRGAAARRVPGATSRNGARASCGPPRRAAPPLGELLGPLTAMIVLPYLGPAAAAREAAKPAVPRPRARPTRGDPLRDLEMRLTYRTVRVLRAIAARPGASNREVADAAGVHDQGQISKLLTRLEHLGLIRNGGSGPLRGEPNAWRLSERGEEVERTIRQQTAPAAS